jgi:hypothetical protein
MKSRSPVRPRRARSRRRTRPRPARLADETLLERLQRGTFRFFWEGAHPASGLALDRRRRDGTGGGPVAVGGSGFGALAILGACERGWVSRKAALARFARMVDCLESAQRHHGAWPHFLDGDTGATIAFGPDDDGGDLVETSFLIQGLLAARAYFDGRAREEAQLRERLTRLWLEVEWDWYTRGGRPVLSWHWSPTRGFALNLDIRGWNECLITYLLAAASPRHGIPAAAYHEGWARGRDFLNGRSFEGIQLPLGPDAGGPLFFAHFSFCGLDPRGLHDTYADYWQQNLSHTRINHAHCVRNPHGYRGYGTDCWGLSAGDSISGYSAHAPGNDLGVITPSAALSSFPYAPREAMAALRHFYADLGTRLWGDFGFIDGFSEQHDWYADAFVAVNQGPIVAMIENYRSALLWKLFMGIPEIRSALGTLGFRSPHLA